MIQIFRDFAQQRKFKISFLEFVAWFQTEIDALLENSFLIKRKCLTYIMSASGRFLLVYCWLVCQKITYEMWWEFNLENSPGFRYYIQISPQMSQKLTHSTIGWKVRFLEQSVIFIGFCPHQDKCKESCVFGLGIEIFGAL